MRIEVAGAQITEAVADVLDTLQNDSKLSATYIQALDEVTRQVILDLSGSDEEADLQTLGRLRALQMIRRDLVTLSSPPGVDDQGNDAPTASF